MTKIKIRDAITHIHDKHIDVSIPMEYYPFKAYLGQVMFCQIKNPSKLGTKLDNRIHIVIVPQPDKTNSEKIILKNKVNIEEQKDK